MHLSGQHVLALYCIFQHSSCYSSSRLSISCFIHLSCLYPSFPPLCLQYYGEAFGHGLPERCIFIEFIIMFQDGMSFVSLLFFVPLFGFEFLHFLFMKSNLPTPTPTSHFGLFGSLRNVYFFAFRLAVSLAPNAQGSKSSSVQTLQSITLNYKVLLTST